MSALDHPSRPKKILRLAVSGSRRIDVHQAQQIHLALRMLRPYSIVVGDAHGVDAAVRAWAEKHNVMYAVHEADWKKYGRAAGPVRNREIIRSKPDYWVAFPTASSVGTKDFIKQARRAGIHGHVHELT